MANDKADHKLKVAIISDGKTTNGILCEVFLPKRLTDPIKLILSPPKNQQHLAHLFEFSIYGELKGFSGKLQTLIEAKKVYFKEGGTTHWGPDISETILVGDPFDLKITKFINGNSDPGNQDGVFWLTPSIMLTPLEVMSSSYTGEVKVEKSRNFEFNLPCGVKLHFAHHYRYLKGNGKDTIRFPELVAEYENIKNENSIDLILQELDDFLMITSFSARQRSVCLGVCRTFILTSSMADRRKALNLL